ncbi:hypothetical protein QOZ80_5BG0434500 [Eleusine coracana subsp. coracana]|nr:hypothetical protein QOZ80_5BG0434500 [Eleusine coracana subsp. coracana]
MYRPPRARATAPGGTSSGRDAAGGSSPICQVPHGLHDPVPNQFEMEAEVVGLGMARRPVIPATGIDGRMPLEEFSPEDFVANDILLEAMESGSYFTDLLANDVEESEELAPPAHTPTQHVPTTGKGSQGRTKNFREEEDRLLVSAWLNVGMDPIKGVDQGLTAYWARIHEYFHYYKKFEIEARNQSGLSVDDKIANACALLMGEGKKKKFTFMHCWKILKDKAKWIERRRQFETLKTGSNKKQKLVATSSPSAIIAPDAIAGNAEPSANDGGGRLDGKKKEN